MVLRRHLPGSVPPMRTRLATDEDAEALRTIYNREVVGTTVTLTVETKDDKPVVTAIKGEAMKKKKK